MQKIASAFLKAQTQFAPALKTNTNPHFKSKYAALDACIEAVIDALHSNGIAMLQPTRDAEGGVKVETLFLHESGEQLSGGTLFVPADKQNPQGYGSALTYARRYSLMAACGIAPEDDDGNAGSQPKQPQQPTSNPFNMDDAKQKLGVCKTLDDLKKSFGSLWNACPKELQAELNAYKDEIKSLIESIDKKAA